MKGKMRSFQKYYPKMILDTAIEDLGVAFSACANPNMPRNKRPRFHRKKDDNLSFRLYRKNNYSFSVNDKCLKFFKRNFKLTEALRFSGEIKVITIKKEFDGWFACITTDYSKPQNTQQAKTYVGIDWGIRKFLTLSDGTIINLPKRYFQKFEKIKRLQERKSKTKEGSNRNKKAKTKLSRAWVGLNNIKTDFLYKTVNEISRKYSHAGVETLLAQQLYKLSKINSRGGTHNVINRFYNILENKMCVYHAPAFYRSTNRCSCCDHELTGQMKIGSSEIFKCPFCEFTEDRDLNAAKNLENVARQNI